MTVGHSLFDNGDGWVITQHLTTGDGFPYRLHVDDIQVCVDYAALHHQCCWTRALLHPLLEKLQTNFVNIKENRVEDGNTSPQPSRMVPSSIVSHAARKTLTELSESIRHLFERQQQPHQRPPCGSVNRIRYVHLPPPVVRIGKGIAGTLNVTFSLQRCSDPNAASSTLFPSFLAVEPCESIAPFVTIAVFEARRRSTTCKRALLLLQNINMDDDVATYSSLDAELHFGGGGPWSSPLPLCTFYWTFRVYAAFYNSTEDQIRLDEPFMHLNDWKPSVTQEERFAVMNPNMDVEVAFSVEKRLRANMERRIRSAIAQMDCAKEGKGVSASVSSSSGATLRHIATLQTSRCIVMETCTQPGNGTLSAVMPRDIKWPLQLFFEDSSGRVYYSSPIAGSSSLERLTREMNKLEERVGIEVDADDGKVK